MPGQIRKRGERRWLVRVYLGRDPVTGRRSWFSKTVHGTRKDAETLLRELLRRKDLGMVARPSSMPLGEMLERYLETAAARVKPSTMRIYTQAVRLWISPQLGSRRLCDLQPVDIHRLYETLRRRGLSARSIQITHNVLRAALKLAVRWNLLPASPMDRVDPPRVVRREMRALDPDQARRFLAAAREDRYGALWWLLLETGMRPSEALALRWEDVDLARRVVRVQRSLVYVGRSYRFEEPKTRGARRSVPVSEGLARALAQQRGKVEELRTRAGELWREHGLVFPSELGTPLRLDNLRARSFYRILERAGIPREFRIYDLRHTSATLLLLADEHPKVVAERLGHATVHMTLDTYSHLLPTLQRRATEKIAGLLGAGGDGRGGGGEPGVAGGGLGVSPDGKAVTVE